MPASFLGKSQPNQRCASLNPAQGNFAFWQGHFALRQPMLRGGELNQSTSACGVVWERQRSEAGVAAFQRRKAAPRVAFSNSRAVRGCKVAGAGHGSRVPIGASRQPRQCGSEAGLVWLRSRVARPEHWVVAASFVERPSKCEVPHGCW